MVIEFHCPHCDAKLKAGVKLAGQSGACPNCGKELTVPSAEEVTTETEEATEEQTEEATQTADRTGNQDAE